MYPQIPKEFQTFSTPPLKGLIINLYRQMNLISNLQKEYEQLWKYIIRPTRLPYL